MILSALGQIALAHNLVFIYGERAALDQAVNSRAPGSSTVFLYHEGYVSGPLFEDEQGYFESNYALRLNLLTPSEVADLPAVRLPTFERFEPLMKRVLMALSLDYELSNVFIRDYINQTVRNLDGIGCTLSAKPKANDQSWVC